MGYYPVGSWAEMEPYVSGLQRVLKRSPDGDQAYLRG